MISPSNATANCIFLSGFTGSARCTVQYGTDPTYMSLPYSANSTETGTAGDTVSVILSERLNSSTVYYYTVSAVSGMFTMTVRGTFTTPLYSKYINTCVNKQCQERSLNCLSLPEKRQVRFYLLLHDHRLFSGRVLEPTSC